VIEASQVEQSMKHQHLDLDRQGMSLFARLAPRGGHSDGEIAGDSFLVPDRGFRREGENIRGFVLAAKLPVEPANGAVSGQQHRNVATQADGLLRLAQKP
jgi:hypothetical protein